MSQAQKNGCNDKIYDKDMKGKESEYLSAYDDYKMSTRKFYYKRKEKIRRKSEINENYFSKLITSQGFLKF